MTDHTSPTIAIKTLGCKLNQFESQQIRQQFAALGCCFVAFESVADVYVINSCTVTARTDRDCRRLVRHAKALNPHACVVVTGCYAEANPAALEAIAEADLVAGNALKPQLAALVRERLAEALPWPERPAGPTPTAYADAGDMIAGFADHTRAFVKVQEGCNAACTYCIVPRARGASRSIPAGDVAEQVRRLVAAGHAEIVLIGTHLGRYGEGLADGSDLVALIERLVAIPGLGRLRLSSIEPGEVPPPLVELVAHHPAVCRHLHIPLQSGCDSVLARMSRPCNAAAYADLVARIHQADPGICLGADVMVGFPGETEQEFEATRQLIEAGALSYLHVFTYSPRPGTVAADMTDQVPHEVKIARNHILRDLSEARRARFANSQVGAVLACVLERPLAGDPDVLEGLTDNYLRVAVGGPPTLLGTLQPVRVMAATAGLLRGHLAMQSHR